MRITCIVCLVGSLVACQSERAKPVYTKDLAEISASKNTSEALQLKNVWARYGIASVRSLGDWSANAEGNRLQVGLFSDSDAQIGRADVTVYENQAEGFSYSVEIQGFNRVHVRFDVDKSTGLMRLNDLNSGKVGNVTPDEATKSFVRDEAASEILRTSGEDLIVVGLAVYADVVPPESEKPDDGGVFPVGKREDAM